MNAQVNNKALYMVMVPMGIALNLAMGLLITTLKLPIFLDAIGTIFFTIIAGWRLGTSVGVLSFLIGGMFNPVLPYFAATQCGIAIVTTIAAKMGAFKKYWSIVMTGIIMGFVAAILSAPVIAVLFGGITTSGESIITGILIATGKNLWIAVATTKAITEPLDKTLQCFAAFFLIKSMPRKLMEVLHEYPGYLNENGL
jgi:energy-coupling factor transport system substrate-specific component